MRNLSKGDSKMVTFNVQHEGVRRQADYPFVGGTIFCRDGSVGHVQIHVLLLRQNHGPVELAAKQIHQRLPALLQAEGAGVQVLKLQQVVQNGDGRLAGRVNVLHQLGHGGHGRRYHGMVAQMVQFGPKYIQSSVYNVQRGPTDRKVLRFVLENKIEKI